MHLAFKTVRGQGIAAALCLVVLGTTLVACGGGGGGGGATPTPTPTPTGYTSGRPAAATTPVTTAADLSNAIGIEGAATVSGSIPAPNASALSSRMNQASTLLARTVKVDKKLATTSPKPRIANDSTNYAAIQGGWIIDAASTPPTLYGGYLVDGDSVYAAVVQSGVCSDFTPVVTTADFLAAIQTLDSNSAVLTGGTTLTRDTTDVLAVCGTGTGTSTGAYGGTITATGQVLFTDNSTFNYTFNSASTPTAVFVQIEGADEYFVVPFSALTSDGAGGYTITFYGPTAGDTQIITSTLTGQINFQVFYGQVALADLLNATFTGSTDATNWSAPAYVDCVTQAVATGDLQFNLTWNTANDVDLHVIEPGGNEIDYTNTVSASGGELDVDDVDGYGPENIFWAATVPAGTYSVFVVNYDGDAAPGYTLTVTKQGVSTAYTGSLAATAGVQSVPITVTVP